MKKKQPDLKNRPKTLTDISSNKIQMTDKHMKCCCTSYVISAMQIKRTMRYHHIPVRMVEIQNTDNTKCC